MCVSMYALLPFFLAVTGLNTNLSGNMLLMHEPGSIEQHPQDSFRGRYIDFLWIRNVKPDGNNNFSPSQQNLMTSSRSGSPRTGRHKHCVHSEAMFVVVQALSPEKELLLLFVEFSLLITMPS